MLQGRHSCRNEWWGDWTVGERDQYIQLDELLPIIKERNPVLISHSEIGWKAMNHPSEKIHGDGGLRYLNADIDCPCILAEGVYNPAGKKYRMVDGSHRITKMKMETNRTESYFYVLTNEEFYSYLKDYIYVEVIESKFF
jgi:hypothetical protein